MAEQKPFEIPEIDLPPGYQEVAQLTVVKSKEIESEISPQLELKAERKVISSDVSVNFEQFGQRVYYISFRAVPAKSRRPDNNGPRVQPWGIRISREAISEVAIAAMQFEKRLSGRDAVKFAKHFLASLMEPYFLIDRTLLEIERKTRAGTSLWPHPVVSLDFYGSLPPNFDYSKLIDTPTSGSWELGDACLAVSTYYASNKPLPRDIRKFQTSLESFMDLYSDRLLKRGTKGSPAGTSRVATGLVQSVLSTYAWLGASGHPGPLEQLLLPNVVEWITTPKTIRLPWEEKRIALPILIF